MVKTVSPAGRDANSPQVAVDRRGNVLVVWSGFDGFHDRIMMRRISASGGLGPVRTLSAAHQDAIQPQVAFDANGNAYVVWIRFEPGSRWRVQIRRRSATGSLSPVHTLSAPGESGDPQVGVDRDGNALVVWHGSGGGEHLIRFRRVSPAGVLGPIELLSQRAGYAPQIAVDADGNALVVWQRFVGSSSRIELRRRSPSGSLSAMQTLSATGADANRPQLAMEDDGSAVVVWQRTGIGDRIQLRRRSAEGRLSAVQTVSAAGIDAFSPQVALNASGNALVVWQGRETTHWRIQVRRQSTSGGLNAVQNLSPSALDAFLPQLAIDGANNAAIVWQQYDGISWSIKLRHRMSGGHLGQVQMLSPPGPRPQGTPVAIDAIRTAWAVWPHSGGSHFRIQASRADLGAYP
jgi:hypothetical protein